MVQVDLKAFKDRKSQTHRNPSTKEKAAFLGLLLRAGQPHAAHHAATVGRSLILDADSEEGLRNAQGTGCPAGGPREATVNRSLQTEHHRATDPPCPLGMGGPERGAAATRPQPGVPVAYRRWRWLRHVPASTWLCSELRRGFGPPLVPASDAPRVCAARIGPRTRA